MLLASSLRERLPNASPPQTKRLYRVTARRADILTLKRISARGLRRDEAAAYIGIGSSKFDEMVDDERMPRPRVIDRVRVWDKNELDFAFSNLPHDDEEEKGAGWKDAS